MSSRFSKEEPTSRNYAKRIFLTGIFAKGEKTAMKNTLPRTPERSEKILHLAEDNLAAMRNFSFRKRLHEDLHNPPKAEFKKPSDILPALMQEIQERWVKR